MTLPDIDIKLLNLNEKIELRKKVQKQISEERRNKNLRVTTFIPALKINDFNFAKEWAFEKKFIIKNTNWAFTKFAVLNTIDLILTEIKAEMEHQQELSQKQDNLNVPIQATNQPNATFTEPHTEYSI